MIDAHPILQTERLVLRAFTLADAPEVQRMAGDRDIASTTAVIPHPYDDGVAEAWIGSYDSEYAEGRRVNFAITRRADGILVGCIGLGINREHERAELGYWIGKPYWNQGIATEAARAVISYGFDTLKLHRIFAHYLTRNPASGRVMSKAGMRYEGTLREHVLKWETFEDIALHGVLARDWQS